MNDQALDMIQSLMEMIALSIEEDGDGAITKGELLAMLYEVKQEAITKALVRGVQFN